MAESYFTLEYGSGYLKNWTNDESNGVADEGNQRTFTAQDLLDSEATAYREIRSRLIGFYDVAEWSADVPPVVAEVAEMLGAGYMWLKRFGSDAGIADANAITLLTQGRQLLSDLRRGTMSIVKSDGSVQARRSLQDNYELA